MQVLTVFEKSQSVSLWELDLDNNPNRFLRLRLLLGASPSQPIGLNNADPMKALHWDEFQLLSTNLGKAHIIQLSGDWFRDRSQELIFVLHHSYGHAPER